MPVGVWGYRGVRPNPLMGGWTLVGRQASACQSFAPRALAHSVHSDVESTLSQAPLRDGSGGQVAIVWCLDPRRR